MKTVTDEAARAYIEANGEHCPYCGSINITTTDRDLPYMYILCLNCKETWTDTYRLVGIDNYIVPDYTSDQTAALKSIYEALQFITSSTLKGEMLTMIIYAYGRAKAAITLAERENNHENQN